MITIEEIATEIVDSCYKIHKSPGPGLLESAYEACLDYESIKRGFDVEAFRKTPGISC